MTDPNFFGKSVDENTYLLALFQSSDCLAILLRNSSRPQTVQRIATRTRILEPSFQEWLRFKNEREGFNVYIGMNPLKPASHTRTKGDILQIRHLYLDLDSDGPKALDQIQQSSLVPTPNYILSTSPDRFQVVWRVQDAGQEQAETLLRVMARQFGGDPAATDSTRVLRIPGFANKKCNPEFVVRAHEQSDRVSQLVDFRVQIEVDDDPHKAVGAAGVRNHSSRPWPLSQSEHDWAFAKRALGRGDAPQDVIRRIADFRSNDKHNPEYYARHTVTKAQADSQNKPGTEDSEIENPHTSRELT